MEELAENQGISAEGSQAIKELANIANVKTYKEIVNQQYQW